MRTHSVLGFVFGGIALVTLAATPAFAQMDHTQMHGAQGMPGMQDHAAMMASTDQLSEIRHWRPSPWRTTPLQGRLNGTAIAPSTHRGGSP